VHYHNEIEALFLLSFALYLISRLETTGPRTRTIVAIGVTLGCLPYAKLQSIPLGLVLAAWSLVILACGETSPDAKAKRLAALGLSGAAPTLALLAWLHAHGLASEFFFYYVRANLGYGYRNGFPGAVRAFRIFMPGSAIAAGSIVIPLFALAARSRLRTRSFVWLACLLAATCDAIARPGWYFPHYYSFLLPFLVLGGALGYGALTSAVQQRAVSVAALLFGCISLLLSAAHRKEVLAASGLRPIIPGVAASEILKLANSPGDSIAVWGWYPVLNVETNLPSATKENHSFYTLYSPLADEFEERYLRDLARNRPVVFVDSRVMWIERYVSFERKPAIARYVAEHYTYYGTFPGSRFYAGNPVDLYVDKQRAKLAPERGR
jgi:hypothetical protein